MEIGFVENYIDGYVVFWFYKMTENGWVRGKTDKVKPCFRMYFLEKLAGQYRLIPLGRGT